MTGRSRHAPAAIVLAPLLAAVFLGLDGPRPADAAVSAPSGPLTPELAKLATPAVRAESPAAQAEAIGVPAEGPGSLIREGDRVVVEAHFDEGALARLEALRAAGAQVALASRRYQTVALSVAPEDLEGLAEVPGLSAVAPSRRPMVYGAGETASTAAAGSGGLCEGGSVISQGLAQLNVPAARAAFGARGAGETIGVLSDTFNKATTAIGGGTIASHAHQDEVSNDLPGPASGCVGQQVPVRVIADGPTAEATDEGRAMLQVVHDLAPHAELAFATAYSTELEFAHNIERLAEPVGAGGAGADVIVDDVGYFGEPFFQDGPIADAIQKVTEDGVVYLTAAGNNNLEDEAGNGIASWERSDFHDAACPGVVASQVGEAASNCMNFSPSATDPTFGITVAPKSTLTVDLQWAEPWFGVHSDLDAYLLNAAGTEIIAVEAINNGQTGPGAVPEPVEILGWENPNNSKAEVQLVIDRCIHNCNPNASLTAKPRLKFELLEDGDGVSATEYPSSNAGAGITVGPTIYGHSGSAAAITLAAVEFGESASHPFEPEFYSSRGPVTHYLGPVSGTTPAAELAAPEELEKPNLTATDCASTTFFASHGPDGWHFCGTSEAAPHAAAVAALMMQTEPLATPAEILAKMESSATPFIGVSARTAVGAGLLNADAALEALGGSPVVDPSTEPEEVVPTEESPSEEPTPVTEPPVVPQPQPANESAPAGTITKPADTVAPRARIVGHPAVLIRTAAGSIVARFRLRASEPDVTFFCQFDSAAPRACPQSFRHRFGVGRHVLEVRAEDAAGNLAATPAVFRFRVESIPSR
ncbi:MAG TPA: S8 family serine peptidase [Solirubrobacterales bacterium]|jgi:hypothetical protein